MCTLYLFIFFVIFYFDFVFFFFFFFYLYGDPRDLHSFPTRRSSDLRDPCEFVDLLAHGVERAPAGGVLEADDAVLDPRRAEDLDQRDVARPRDVRAAARLDVPLRDLDDAQLAPGDGAPLVEPEAELPLGDVAGHELRPHLASREDLLVRERLDLRDLRVRERVEVRDVQARHVGGLVRPRLPHVVPERLARGAEDDVRRGVVPHQRLAPPAVDRARHARADERRRVAADEVQHGRPAPLDIENLAVGDRAVVRLLAAAC